MDEKVNAKRCLPYVRYIPEQQKSCYNEVSNGFNAMKHVRLSDAREQIDNLLNEVEHGETLMISREGAPLQQENGQWPIISDEQRKRAREAIDAIKEARKTAPRVSVEEILAWRDEGRKY